MESFASTIIASKKRIKKKKNRIKQNETKIDAHTACTGRFSFLFPSSCCLFRLFIVCSFYSMDARLIIIPIDDLTKFQFNFLLIKCFLFDRSGARENDTTLIVGGLDWLSAQHFDTIRRVLHRYELYSRYK